MHGTLVGEDFCLRTLYSNICLYLLCNDQVSWIGGSFCFVFLFFPSVIVSMQCFWRLIMLHFVQVCCFMVLFEWMWEWILIWRNGDFFTNKTWGLTFHCCHFIRIWLRLSMLATCQWFRYLYLVKVSMALLMRVRKCFIDDLSERLMLHCFSDTN